MSRCPHCEEEIEEGARFCGACGRPISQTAISQRAAALARKGAAAAETIRVSPAAPGAHSAVSSPASAGGPAPSSPAPPPYASLPAPAAVVSSTPSIAPATPSPARPALGLRPAAQPLETLIGRTLNHRYLVEDKVGEGGFGAVFRGKQIATGREVALKILHPHNVSDETIVARFRREAEACSKLRDPHTVTTYDFDETPDGILYLAMELLRGHSLHQVQKSDGPLPFERVLRILDQVAASLAEAHANGIVHRDMKPENVFIETREGEDHVKVLDFGIAKVVSDERQVPALTAVGQTLGTLEFMSPEQLRGQKLDGRSDIYALGMMSYEMLTGTLPFASAKSPIDIINFHMRHEPPAPSKLSDKVTIPAAVDAIILKMVAKDKDKRFHDANALREEIARTQRSLDSSPDRFEAYRVVAVVGGIIAVVTALLFLLHR
ncbi:MAG TPA: serine/threonine-protein kinase [Polyangia bacterium]|jgi:serine/threonine-protein kinase|nr:serine/threonine-protein kinase [Polyangia bacterium]